MMTGQSLVVIAMFGVTAVHAGEYVDRADANGDGFVSLYELRAAHYADPEFNRRIEQSFQRYDRDADGLISAAERRAERRAEEQTRANTVSEQQGAERVIDDSDRASPAEPDAITEGELASTAKESNPINDASNGPDATAPPAPTRAAGTNGRAAAWIRDIDTDNSGGASMAELVASGDGKQWFRDVEFDAADRNEDGDLNATELAALLRSLERRQR